MLLGLIPECVKALSEGEHRVLKVWGRTGGSYLLRLLGWWWRWVGRGLANVSLGIAQGAIPSSKLIKLILVRGLMTRVIWLLRSRDTRCVPLDRYGLDRMKPSLIVIQGHPGSFAQAKDQKGVPQVHLRISVIEDGIHDNLPHIKRNIL